MGDGRVGKVLIVGGAGFIGSHIANRLSSLSYKVAVLDVLSTGKRENLDGAIELHLADTTDSRSVEKVLRKERPEIIINEAAKVYWQEKGKKPISDVSITVLGTLNLLENCVKYEVRKFIFASSISVYSPSNRVKVNEGDTVSVENIPQPLFSYAITKSMAEQYARYFNKRFGLDYAILRYAHVYGPGQIGQKDVISTFINSLIHDKPLTVIGKGGQIRDYVYIDDVTDATIGAIGSGNGTFNIGGGRPVSVNHLIRVLEKISGKKAKVRNIKSKEECDGIYMDITKAEQELKWTPKVSLEEGLSQTLDYFSRLQ